MSIDFFNRKKSIFSNRFENRTFRESAKKSIQESDFLGKWKKGPKKSIFWSHGGDQKISRRNEKIEYFFCSCAIRRSTRTQTGRSVLILRFSNHNKKREYNMNLSNVHCGCMWMNKLKQKARIQLNTYHSCQSIESIFGISIDPKIVFLVYWIQ